MQKDECSMTKSGLQAFTKCQGKIVNIVFKKRSSRNSPINSKMKIIRSISQAFLGKTYRSLPKLKEELKIKKENSTSILNYYEKKKRLSFYKGTNINVSTILLDGNKTAHTNTNISFKYFNLQKNSSSNNIHAKSNDKIKTKKEEIKSTINPLIDMSKLNYTANITYLRNKFSVMFNKEFDSFEKYIQNLDTLIFEKTKKEVLSQFYNKSFSCIKYLSGIFLEQDIEHLKIDCSNLTSILTNLFNLFFYTNKVNQCLVNQIKNYMMEINKEKQNKKDSRKVDDSDEIKYLKNKIKIKSDTVRTLKKEQLKINNDYMINMYKLKDEKKDLVRLLLMNKHYYKKFKNSQKEIKEKNEIISQKNLDYKMLIKKNMFDKVEMEEINNELQNTIKSKEQENKKLKDNIIELENERNNFDRKIKIKNEIINQLQENLKMKDEELIKCLYDLNKAKFQNDKLTYDYLALKKKIND